MENSLSINLIHVSPDLVDPNPWQTRRRSGDGHVERLAQDIKEHGLIHPPVARVHPTEPGRYQLAVGHNRTAAWRIAFPGQTMPLDVRALDDRTMSEYAIVENDDRDDLTVTEKAQALVRYMQEFHVPQAQAGKLFDLESQSAVSNFLRILQLPPVIHPLVDDASLPQRLARDLLPIARLSPDLAVNIARQIAKADPRDKDRIGASLIRDAFWHQAARLQHAHWPQEWPAQPMSVDIARPDKGEPSQIPACKGCEWKASNDRNDFCLRPACYGLKTRVWAQAEAERVAKAHKLSTVQPGESVTVVWSGSYSHRDTARKALASNHTSLRIAPWLPAKPDYDDGERKTVLGSGVVALFTTDAKALAKAMNAVKVSKPKETDYQAKYRAERARANELNKQSRALVTIVAPYIGQAIPENTMLLDMLFAAFKYDSSFRSATDALKKWHAANAQERRAMIASCLVVKAVDITSYSVTPPSKAARKIGEIAKGLGVKLPAGWDKLPSKAKTAKPDTRKAAKRKSKK